MKKITRSPAHRRAMSKGLKAWWAKKRDANARRSRAMKAYWATTR